MIIELSPARSDLPFEVTTREDTISINGTEYDFSSLEEGEEILREELDPNWFMSSVVRLNGEVEFTLYFPLGSNPPDEARYPMPLKPTKDGAIEAPERQKEEDNDLFAWAKIETESVGSSR